MQDEIHKLQVRVMELERGALIGGRRPGNSRADDRDSELRFERTTMRQTYHFGESEGTFTIAIHVHVHVHVYSYIHCTCTHVYT